MKWSGERGAVSEPVIAADLQSLLVGLAPGINKDQTPLWLDARDVMFDLSSVRPSSGFDALQIVTGLFDEHTGNFDSATGLFDASQTIIPWPTSTFTRSIKGIHQQKLRDGRVLVVVGTDKDLVTFDSALGVTSSYNNLNGIGQATDVYDTTLWSFEQWGNWVVATNGVDSPKLLKKGTSDTFITLPGFASVANKCQIFRTLGPHMIAFNTDNDSNQMLACKADDVETWDYSTNATAVELTFRDFAGPIIAAEKMGKNIALYGEQGLHLLAYGGSFLFGAQPAARGIKAVSKNSIAVVGSVHYAIQESGIFKTDGVSVAPCAAQQMGDWLRREIDWNQRTRICALVDLQRNLIKWSVPLNGSNGNTRVILYNYANDTISFESTPFTAAARAQGLNVPLAGFSSGAVQAVTDNPTGRVPYLISRPFPLDSKRAGWVYIDVLQGRVKEAGLGMKVRFGGNLSDFDDAAVTNPWVSVSASMGVDEATFYVSREAVYMQLRLDGAADTLWHLSGLDAHGMIGGRRF